MDKKPFRGGAGRYRRLTRTLEAGAVFVSAFAAFLSTTGLHFSAAQAVPVAVPEPAGIGLLAVGAAGVAAVVSLRRYKGRGKGD